MCWSFLWGDVYIAGGSGISTLHYKLCVSLPHALSQLKHSVGVETFK